MNLEQLIINVVEANDSLSAWMDTDDQPDIMDDLESDLEDAQDKLIDYICGHADDLIAAWKAYQRVPSDNAAEARSE